MTLKHQLPYEQKQNSNIKKPLQTIDKYAESKLHL